jgi:hypothetical protein
MPPIAAPFLACVPAHHRWHRRLFVAPLAEADRVEIFERARAEGRAFLERRDPGAFDARRAALDGWYRSAHGQEVLCAAFRRLWRHFMALARHAMPAHDARHAVVLVPASAVLIAHDEGVAGSARLGVLAALLHDQGRWAEARLHGHPTPGELHARLGFLLAREFLGDTDIPPPLQDELLHAVLVHTRGATAADPIVTRLAVAADMTQLHGPEFVLRLVHHLSLPPAPSCFVDEAPGTSLLDRFDHFLGQRRDLLFPSLVDARERGLAHLWAFGEHLVGRPAWEARPAAAQRLRSPALDAALAAQRRRLREAALDTSDPSTWAARLIEAPLACDRLDVRAAVADRVARVPQRRRRPLAEALALSTAQRDAQAAAWRGRLDVAAARYAGEDDRFLATVARQLEAALVRREAAPADTPQEALAEPA